MFLEKEAAAAWPEGVERIAVVRGGPCMDTVRRRASRPTPCCDMGIPVVTWASLPRMGGRRLLPRATACPRCQPKSNDTLQRVIRSSKIAMLVTNHKKLKHGICVSSSTYEF